MCLFIAFINSAYVNFYWVLSSPPDWLAFPAEEAAHVALQTVREYFEQSAYAQQQVCFTLTLTCHSPLSSLKCKLVLSWFARVSLWSGVHSARGGFSFHYLTGEAGDLLHLYVRRVQLQLVWVIDAHLLSDTCAARCSRAYSRLTSWAAAATKGPDCRVRRSRCTGAIAGCRWLAQRTNRIISGVPSTSKLDTSARLHTCWSPSTCSVTSAAPSASASHITTLSSYHHHQSRAHPPISTPDCKRVHSLIHFISLRVGFSWVHRIRYITVFMYCISKLEFTRRLLICNIKHTGE